MTRQKQQKQQQQQQHQERRQRRLALFVSLLAMVFVWMVFSVHLQHYMYWNPSSKSQQQQQQQQQQQHVLSFALHPCVEGDQVCRDGLFLTRPKKPLDHLQEQEQKQEHPNAASSMSLPLERDLLRAEIRRLRQEHQDSLPKEFPKRIVPRHEWAQRDNHTCLLDSQTSTTTTTSTRPPLYEWQTRAPYVVILGTQKGGTQALSSYLWQHPLFVSPDDKTNMEGHFFENPALFVTRTTGIPVVRNQKRYAQFFQTAYAQNLFRENQTPRPHVLAIDTTPYYLMQSDIVPHGLKCVAPWAKWIALLRNPVTRLESHYRMWQERKQSKHQPVIDLETWIRHDMAVLHYYGVVSHSRNSNHHSKFIQEYNAWKAYLRSPLSSGKIVGRGLYVFQLQQYIQAIPPEKTRDEQLLVLPSEALRHETQATYNRILKFLQLPPFTLMDTAAVHASSSSSSLSSSDKHQQGAADTGGGIMPRRVKKLLQDFYRPYNQRLYRLLNWTKENNPYLWDDDTHQDSEEFNHND